MICRKQHALVILFWCEFIRCKVERAGIGTEKGMDSHVLVKPAVSEESWGDKGVYMPFCPAAIELGVCERGGIG